MGMVATDELYDAFETVPRLIGSSKSATWERGIEVALAKTGHLDLIAEDSAGDPPGNLGLERQTDLGIHSGYL